MLRIPPHLNRVATLPCEILVVVYTRAGTVTERRRTPPTHPTVKTKTTTTPYDANVTSPCWRWRHDPQLAVRKVSQRPL